jgi:hypothetical protein
MNKEVVIVLALLGVALGVLVLAWWITHLKLKQVQKCSDAIVHELLAKGWQVDASPHINSKRETWNALPIPWLGRDEQAIHWIAHGQADGVPVSAFGHSYVVKTLESTSAHTKTLVATTAIHSLPVLIITKRQWWHRIMGAIEGTYPSIDNQGPFDRSIVVASENHAAARAVLTESVRAWALNWLSDRDAMIVMNSKGVTLIRQVGVQPQDVIDMAHHVARALREITIPHP